MNATETCWEQNSVEAGPLGFQYLAFHYCAMADFQFASVVLLLALMVLLFYLLGDTADAYFSPTLATICEKLHVSYDVAGVTFLAFGNGAPDVFASIAAYTAGGSGDEALIGLNALLGAGMFVTTVVVGCVVLVTPVAVQPRAFVRDVLCYSFALGVLSYVLSEGSISLLQASLFLILYALYVSVVIAADIYAKRHGVEPTTETQMGGVTSAFWHSPSSAAAHDREAGPNNSYTFLTLESGTAPLMGGDGDDGDGDDDGLEGGAGAMEGGFAHAIHDDYFPSAEREVTAAAGAEVAMTLLRAQEPSEVDGEGQGGDDADHRAPRPLRLKRLSKRGGSVWDGLYFSHLRWRKSTRSALLDGVFGSHSRLDAVLAVLLWPLRVMRDVSIPTIEEDQWSRLKAGGYPLWSSLLMLFVSGHFHSRVGSAPLWVLVALAGAGLGVCVFFFTHASRPPSSRFQQLVFVFSGFVLCIAWIYTLASELVSLLLALGKLSGLPSSVLGLTVLAWGNSLGDLITNIAVAKSGFADMAIAGCYGGPLFNLLISLGVAFSYNCAVAYPERVALPEDDHVVTSIGFLFASLATSLGVVMLSHCRFPRKYGMVLVAVYCLYSFMNVLEAVGALELGYT